MELNASLPAPIYTGEEEELRAQQRGPRIVQASQLSGAIVKKANNIPRYPHRAGWRPQHPEDWGDGGAYPEIPIAQYPQGCGRKEATKSNALIAKVDVDTGKIDYSRQISRTGQSSSFKDLIPLRSRAEAGEIDLSRPSAEDVEETRRRTATALAGLVSIASKSQKKSAVQQQKEVTFVRYTPSNHMGGNNSKKERILKIVERQKDPMEPPAFKHKKIPGRPPSPPPPVMHSPPRKLTADEAASWKIPPAISQWKNQKGFTIALDKRLAADGRGLQDVQINDNFAQLAEALYTADRHAREEVKQRAIMQQRLADKEKAQKEENLRQLAQQARAERNRRSTSGSRSRSYSRSDSESDSDDAERQRRAARKERQREEERKLRQTRMGTQRRAEVMARDMNRDISEKIALGLAKPTQASEAMYDSRLFNQTSGFDSGVNEDNPYDKPLFAAQDAITSIYRPRTIADDDEEGGEQEMAKIQKMGRFGDALGRSKFKGTEDAEAREGPVQFEKDNMDPFNVDKFLSEVEKTSSTKRGYGLVGDDSRQAKRARMDENDV